MLSVCVHGASDLPTMQEDDTCDPYCLVYCNGSKVLVICTCDSCHSCLFWRFAT